MGFFKGLGAVVLVLALVVGGVFGVYGLSLAVYKTFAPAYMSAETDAYRHNKSYIEGTIRDLRDLRVQYLSCAPEHRDALRGLILHRAGELDWDRLPNDLRSFLNELEAV